FAIDDFGVGHAPLDRVASFAATQIKVDRAILSHPLALDELDLVVKLADDGYIAEEPAPQQLRPLSQDLRNRIASLTRRPHHGR
ncbi:MAG TPA: hypothetical protein VFB40_03535, partial [Actinocrinis sp.]